MPDTSLPDPDRSGDATEADDRIDRAEDLPFPVDAPDSGRPNDAISDRATGSDLIADVTLAQGVTYTPRPLRVLRTSYVFRVDAVIQGDVPGDFVTINDTGGAYPDGSTVSTEHSFRLKPGGRYTVFADRVGDELWLRQVLQVHEDGAVVADASGRVVVGIRDGAPVVESVPTYEALRYLRQVAQVAEPMEDPPESGSLSLPVADSPATDPAEAVPLPVETVLDYLRAVGSGTRPADVPPAPAGTSRRPRSNIEGRSQELPGPGGPGARSVLSGNYVTSFQSHFHFMPNDDNWAWAGNCRGSWNTLVDNDLGLFAYKITTATGQPIRDRLPVAGNGQHNVGVLSSTQMTDGGFDTWETLGANGVCYTWTSGNRVTETDILINPAIAGDEAQFRKSLTHEYGHALTLQHETSRMALMYPGTFRQPPNYASQWYSRQDDHHGVRAMLDWVNANAGGTWKIAQFTDMATWSQAHDNPGTAGNLVMTRLSNETIARGATATVQFMHVENRGNVAAQNVRLAFYLSPNEIISSGDHEIASYTWNTFSTWWSGSLNVRVPDSVPPGQYFVGWIVSTSSAERSSSNDIALLLRDRNSGFAPVRITVI
jgi:matrixin